MSFTYRNGTLCAGEVPFEEIADALGTPVYVYSADSIRAGYEAVRGAFAPLGARLHYAVKACGNLQVCALLHELGAGMDVVSGGELERAWLSGTPMSEIVFAGVGKTDDEIRAALDGRFSPLLEDAGPFGRPGVAERGPVGLMNVESPSELERIAALARDLGVVARACLRVNPDVDAKTHEYTTTGKEENKFGIPAERIPSLFADWAGRDEVKLVGLHVHIGSPVHQIGPYVDTVRVMSGLLDRLEADGHEVSVLNLGGGWAVSYRTDDAPPIAAYAEAIVPLLAGRVERGLQILMEPGRSILANSGVLLTRVQHVKRGRRKVFAVCDAGMHTLIRPALYRAYHVVWPVRWDGGGEAPPRREILEGPGLEEYDVVGPICETGDFLARDRPLPPVSRGDLLAVFSAGAYGMSMSSNYNDHGRAAEVLVDGGRAVVVNERQSLASLLATEASPREIQLGVKEVA